MKKPFFLVLTLSFFLADCASLTPLQKTQLIPVFHLIETNKYNEARGAVEDLVSDSVAAGWPRTWYARGLLSHNAYREGITKNDRKLTELYPDQLFVAYESYQKADSLDANGKLDKQLFPKYVLLANDFQKLGEREFNAKKYPEALRAFEHALQIIERPAFELRLDTNLLYNASLAAFEANKWQKAIKYLDRLHHYEFSANVAHLLFSAHLAQGDTLKAEKAITQGIEKYEENENLVLVLADLKLNQNNVPRALLVLDQAILRHPENHVYYNTKGLIYQKTEDYQNAIEAFKKAIELAPEQLDIYINLATSYYNIGVDIDENARSITNMMLVQAERQKSATAFETAMFWLDKVYYEDPDDQALLRRLYELYRLLRVTDKTISLEGKIRWL